jgi:two-component system response regulator GlrR
MPLQRGRTDMKKIMVVDNDHNLSQAIKTNLEKNDFRVFATKHFDNALAKLNSEAFDLALIGLQHHEHSGVNLIDHFQQKDPELPIILLADCSTIDHAVGSIKKGAYSYLTKPFKMCELSMTIENCLESRLLSDEVKRLQKIVSGNYGYVNVIGKSQKMKKVLFQVARAAQSNSTVFINGESGTGKELIARNLHLLSSRRQGPFVAVNCAAIPETLMESELFGYKKGAFTGADQNHPGLLAQAQGGIFFLDEISEMSINMQAKLLRVLENKTIYPVGGTQTVKIDARILAASNKNLEIEVKEGRFREDLFYRIHVIVINLPPLRERKEDIPQLARYFQKKYSIQMKKPIAALSSSAIQKLLQHHWPGNVRELENTIESAVAMTTGKFINADLILPNRLASPGGLTTFKQAKSEFEKDYLIRLIQNTRGNVAQAAKIAGKYRADLYDLFKKHSLDPDEFRS